jgi:GTP-binding protein YchF
MKMGIVGLPNVGKSTFFNALTRAQIPAENYPFCTIDPNVGIVLVPDPRIDQLAQIEHSEKKIPAIIEFVDIAGLVRGASRGEGLGNKFLSHIREVDAIAMIVRCFDSTEIVHVEGSVNPIRDCETIVTELCLSDLETLERRLQRVEKSKKSGEAEAMGEWALLQKLKQELSQAHLIDPLQWSELEWEKIKSYQLLTSKPFLYIANIAEQDLSSPQENKYFIELQNYAQQQKNPSLAISAQIESEIALLSSEDAALFLKDLGLKQRGLDQVIQQSYQRLNLISFFTAGPQESKAWTIPKNTLAPVAAGKIHSDIERGFIRAEIISYEDYVTAGSMVKAKEMGKLRIEGKDYVMQDGDVVHFRFSV